MEIVATILRQLLKGSDKEQIADEYSPIYVNHGLGIFPASSTGEPFTAATIQVTADPITDISEDMGAEQKARATYEYILDMADDPDVIAPIKFLREREIVHFQRFGEIMNQLNELKNKKKFY